MQRLNSNKKDHNHEQNGQAFRPAPYYLRYLSYILDFLIIFELASLMFSALGNKPFGFEIVTNYSANVKPLLSNQELRSFCWMVGLYIFIVFIYFYIDAISGTSIAKYLSGTMIVKVVTKKPKHPNKKNNIQFISALSKSLPVFYSHINIFQKMIPEYINGSSIHKEINL